MIRSLIRVTLSLSLFATACTVASEEDTSSSTDELAAAGAPCKVEIVASSLGVIYSDKGFSLYTFDKDTAGTSTCYDACAQRWPAVVVATSYGIKAPFGVSKRTDGKKQLTLNGQPLYRFANDEVVGDVNGEGIGGVWHLARPEAAHVVTTTAGKVYANGLEMSLYTFDNDTTSDSTCNDQCASRWPALIVPSDRGIEAPFGVTTRTDGKTQVTLDGNPLYTFANDAKPGDVKGDGIGGVWHLARPAAPSSSPY